MNADEQAVAAVVESCQHALNQSKVEAVMNLYDTGGVFMAHH